jgi:hypothetical protein
MEKAKFYQTGSYESDTKFHKYVAWCEVFDENMNTIKHLLNESCRGTWRYCHAKLRKWEKSAQKAGLVHSLTMPEQEAARNAQ